MLSTVVQTSSKPTTKSKHVNLEFRVTAKTQAYEVLRVIGNIPELGSWQVDKSVELKRQAEKS